MVKHALSILRCSHNKILEVCLAINQHCVYVRVNNFELKLPYGVHT